MIDIPFEHSFAETLEGLFVDCEPENCSAPTLLYLNQPLADIFGIEQANHQTLAKCFSGQQLPASARPIAQAYAGHQFGHYNPQLGDGRALLLGEIAIESETVDIALKGSGRTPFSRGGDGRATVSAMLREALISEAMYALGVATTRTLAVTATGDAVYRQTPEAGAVLTRVAASHLRVGSFQYCAARGDTQLLQCLADYAINRHYPEANDYLGLLASVIEQQAQLIAHWMSLGFIHGVMNTDNMSIAGETIDYGPCAFLDTYQPKTVFSSIDQQGRYAYINQPAIGQWNLSRLAESLLPLIDTDQEQAIELATQSLQNYPTRYQYHYHNKLMTKLGLTSWNEDDLSLLQQWLTLMEQGEADFTLAWHHLSDALEGNTDKLVALFKQTKPLEDWLERWRARVTPNAESAIRLMRQNNPWLIPRNHQVEAALAASKENNLEPFNQLLCALQKPYEQIDLWRHYSEPAPQGFTERYRTFCGT